jgi:hypothetical protein
MVVTDRAVFRKIRRFFGAWEGVSSIDVMVAAAFTLQGGRRRRYAAPQNPWKLISHK